MRAGRREKAGEGAVVWQLGSRGQQRAGPGKPFPQAGSRAMEQLLLQSRKLRSWLGTLVTAGPWHGGSNAECLSGQTAENRPPEWDLAASHPHTEAHLTREVR